MADKRVPVYEKGRITGYRPGDLPAKTEVESRAAAYRRQKKGAREEWPGQHEAEAKKIEAEEASSAKAKGVDTEKPKSEPRVNPYKPSEPFS